MTVRLRNQNQGFANLRIVLQKMIYGFPCCLVLSLFFLRFVEVAEAEVVEGDLGEEADSVEIRTEEYSSTGDKK